MGISRYLVEAHLLEGRPVAELAASTACIAAGSADRLDEPSHVRPHDLQALVERIAPELPAGGGTQVVELDVTVSAASCSSEPDGLINSQKVRTTRG
jgi:hypothetical protein